MNKIKIKKVLYHSDFNEKTTILGIKESLVFHGIIEDTKDNYVNFILSKEDYNYIHDQNISDESNNIVFCNGWFIDDGSGIIGTLGNDSERTTYIDDIYVLTIDECICKLKEYKETEIWLLEAIADYYSKKVYNHIKELNEYREILESLDE